MKNKIILSVAVLGVILIAATQITAEPRKLGFLNSQEILALMPQMDSIQKVVQAYGEELNEEYTIAFTKHNKEISDFQDKVKKGEISDSRRPFEEKKLAESAKQLEDLQQVLENDLLEKQQKLLKPLVDKIEAKIKEVAKEKQLGYVFDTSTGALLYADEADNITALVKEKLGIKSNTPSNGGGAAND